MNYFKKILLITLPVFSIAVMSHASDESGLAADTIKILEEQPRDDIRSAPPATVPASAVTEFELGNDAYRQGDYETALDHYLLAEPQLEGLAINYNLGNAYFKLGQIPESILHYERALKFDPDNSDVLYNLSLTNDLIADRIESLPQSRFSREWESFRYETGPDGWAWISIVWSVLSAALLFLFFLGRGKGWRRLGFFAGVIAAALAIASFSLARSAENYRYSEHAAIVFSQKVDVKSEPRGGSINVFTLHSGTKVHILSKEGEWYQVQIASGNRGWMHQNELRII